jgi:O-antigen/teichoic acid export membrane protein
MSELQPNDSNLKKSTRKHIRGSTLLFGGRVISIGLKFFLQILIVRYLSKSDYGAFAYAINMVEIVAIISTMSLDKAASRFIPIYDEGGDYESLFGFIILSFITIFGIGISIILLFAGLQSKILGTLTNDPLIIALLLILISLAPLLAIDSWFQALFAAFSSIRAIFFRRYIVWPGLQLLAILFVIVTESDVQTLAWGYVIGGVIGSAMYANLSYRLLKRRKLLQHFSWNKLNFNAREIFGFSVPTLSSGLAFILRSQIVVVFLEFYRDTGAVAEFRAVLPIANLNEMVYGSFVFLYMPLVARMLTNHDADGINDLYWRTTAWISIATLPIFLVTFVLADPLVTLLFGEKYATSGEVMAILAVGLYFNAILGFNVHTLRIYGVVRYLLVIDVTVMVAAVIAYNFLIPEYGAVGGALGYTIAIILSNILNHFGLAIYTKIDLVNWSYLRIYTMIIMITLLLWGVQFILDPPLFISVPLAAILASSVLYLNREKLQVGEIFPELLKIPVIGKLL